MANPESNVQFEGRKADHIRLSLDASTEASGESGLDLVALEHEALPDLDFKQISLQATVLGLKRPTPFLISSMTAGHADSFQLNLRLAKVAQERGWCMGVGSQRRELHDPKAAQEWVDIRKEVPDAVLFGNIGLAQLIKSKTADIQRLVDRLRATAMFVHLNALQECLQPEGTPEFKGGLKAIERLAKELEVPVIVKETGCGFSKATLKRLRGTGVAALDVSGLGGTHWGRIEGARNAEGAIRFEAARTLANWGISTAESVVDAVKMKRDFEVWASGGVRSGLDAAKLLAMGANAVGFAKPILESALKGEDELRLRMETIEFELKTVLFCTGSRNVSEMQGKKVWKWRAAR